MKHVRDNIYEQGGTFYELESTTMSDNKITADFRPIKGKPTIKPEDLHFKCVVPTAEAEQCIRFALLAKGYYVNPGHCFKMGFISFREGKLFGNNALAFCSERCPLISYEEALELISIVIAPTPEFDIKLRDDVLIRATRSTIWEIRQFARIDGLCFKTYAGENGFLLVKYDGNKHLHGTKDSPTDAWWEAEAGKPVWVPAK